MKSSRRREVDAIVVWKLDRWGRLLPDLIATLPELLDYDPTRDLSSGNEIE